MIQWIRFAVCAFLMLSGVFVIAVGVLGLFRFKFSLNRMHAAAIGDTLGLLLMLAGLIVNCGFQFVSLKMLLVIVFFWLASPVSSHLIAQMIVETDDQLDDHLTRREDD